jgi:hypothetical protein
MPALVASVRLTADRETTSVRGPCDRAYQTGRLDAKRTPKLRVSRSCAGQNGGEQQP